MDTQHKVFLPLLMSCQADLRAYVTVMVRDWQAVDDIMQETVVVLWEKFAEYDTSRPFGAWARGCARLQVMAYYQKQKRSKLVFGEAASAAIEAAMAEMEEQASESQAEAALRQCMDKLNERPRTLLQLRYQEQLGLEDISQRMRMSLAAVKKSMLRTRNLLRDCCAGVLGRQQQGDAHD